MVEEGFVRSAGFVLLRESRRVVSETTLTLRGERVDQA